MIDLLVLAGAVVLATAAWAYVFLRDRANIWPRTWVAAGALSAYSLVVLTVTDRLGEVLGPVTPTEVAVGLAIGGAWLVATHIGHAVLCRLFPAFIAQIRDLYHLGDGDTFRRMVGPVVAMGVAEELLFRGVIQSVAGLAVGVAVYTAVQFIERKWALALAALLGGIVWGGLFAWRDGIVAPIVAHVLWTSMLTFGWRLNGCDADRAEDPPSEREYSDAGRRS